VCFAVLIRTKSVTTLAAHRPAGAAAIPAFIKKGFVIRVGIIVNRSWPLYVGAPSVVGLFY